MSDLATIIIGTALVNNLFLEHALGGEAAEGLSRRLDVAFALGKVLLLLLPLVCMIGYLMVTLLLAPSDLDYLTLPVLVLVIFAVMALLRALAGHVPAIISARMEHLFPLAGFNTAVFGSLLLVIDHAPSAIAALLQGLGYALGFGLVLIILTGMRLRLDALDVPPAFRGLPILLLSAGIMAMAFTGFTGLVAGG